MIWAQGHDRAIGREGGMAWHLPEDLAFFKRMTMGHPVIMGRRTWQSLGPTYQPLPGRKNIVLTRDGDFAAPGALVAASFEEAYELARSDDADALVWIMGGAQIYEAGLALADGIVVTDLDIDVAGADAFAPMIPLDWETMDCAPDRGWHVADNGTRYRMTVYRRRRSGFDPGPLEAPELGAR
ncbi:dihydrofolate reductase [Trueperella pecoris]|uniref:Dihydrofolate reductase n=1 Tax=Trueperella pecoris TaxID=2733571 RepID=A0A7M1R463_9ACTO|nr:dihydrofolate reductase [Trueperella pecoris]QOR48255.1 dihydrofolate reductase [Trueperella pecoris]